FYLDDVLRNVSMVTGQKAFEKELELLFSLPRNLSETLNGDPLRLGQIIINLVNNAVKFTETGEISVSVKQLQKLDGKIELEFSVVDTGIGMSSEHMTNLFKAFTQADGSTTRKYGGTGLGLSISRRLVELMGGTLRVESELGVGSRFTFNIWLDSKDNEEPRGPSLVPSSLNSLKALVVDDNEHALEIMKDMLDILPQEVELANSGLQAVEKLEQAVTLGTPFNLVFMDWNMPEMDGVETSLKIRNTLPKEAQPKIVIVTAYDKEELAGSYDSVDVSGYLSKPVGQSYLFDMLVKLFSADPEDAVSRHSKQQTTNTHKLSNLHVLLTEDNEINQQIATELMEAEGITVTIANNGQEALDRLSDSQTQGFRFDIIFMDLQMPIMDGYEASRRIRHNPAYNDIPLIAMTAHAMVEERERCISIGMNDHVSKPIDPDLLFSTIQKWGKTTEASDSLVDSVARDENKVAVMDAPVANDAHHSSTQSSLFFSDISCLDSKNGLLRVAGNEVLYRRLLSQFIDREYNVVERCKIALEKEDVSLAVLHAHTLKGAAANLGAIRLSDIAARMESAVNQPNSLVDLQPLFDEAQQYINTFFKDLSVVLDRPTPNDNQKLDLSPESVAIVHKLYTQLYELNAGAIDFLDEHYLHLKAILTTDDFEACCRYINDCDFEQASIALRKAVSIYPFDLDKIGGELGGRDVDG
ncbi:response regulator, partial [Vibrio makurazakiensis]|uniref:response regulator n=1 Tax=Vibrio makurazakiensis TaxID=2910250 RepID=UPI003D0C9256